MNHKSPLITLLTDFGEDDGYVGAMKGVILSILPTAQIITITNQVPPQNLYHAARVLRNTYRYYPPHTVHLIVVDPGVGSERQPIAVKSKFGIFVAPDNGVLTDVFLSDPNYHAYKIENQSYWRSKSASHTFHGRDIFSPASAHLAKGIPIENLGERLESPTLFSSASQIEVSSKFVKGEVTYIDHFGNVITNIAPLNWETDTALVLNSEDADQKTRFNSTSCHITCGFTTIHGVMQTYSEVGIHQKLALVGSSKELEIAVNQGNASEVLSLNIGDTVTLHFDVE